MYCSLAFPNIAGVTVTPVGGGSHPYSIYNTLYSLGDAMLPQTPLIDTRRGIVVTMHVSGTQSYTWDVTRVIRGV